MPIFRCSGKLVYFAHIPKCAGSSIEDYLAAIPQGKLAFVDRAHEDRPFARRWSLTSPQHVPAEAMSRFFPSGFFDAAFTVVREPLARMRSAFLFQKYVHETIGPQTSLDSFVKTELARRYADTAWCDGHFLPQSSFLPDNMTLRLFRLEDDGLAQVITYLAEIIQDADWPSNMPHANATPLPEQLPAMDNELSELGEALLRAIYCDDFALYAQMVPAKSPVPMLPVDFDPDQYLKAHPDVAAAGMDAHHHYLLHGRHEGRGWR